MGYGFNSNKSKETFSTDFYSKAQSDSKYLSKKGDDISAGNITALSFIVSSSRKVKKNIKPTTIKGLDTINQVDVVDFIYKSDKQKIPRIGLIAEDSPDILTTSKKDAMNESNVIGVLMKAVQELSAEVEELKKKLD